MENEKQVVDLKRRFPEYFGYILGGKDVYVNAFYDFASYAETLYIDLCRVAKVEKDKLDSNFGDYIKLFDIYYEKFLSLCIDDAHLETIKSEYPKCVYMQRERFCKTMFLKNIKQGILQTKGDGKTYVADECYDQLAGVAKKIFILEKLAGAETKKIWQKELTKIENLDLSKPYKIMVKIVFPRSWRFEKPSKELKTFESAREYQSASIISETDNERYMRYYKDTNEVAALLVYESDAKKVISACTTDSYSDEFINGQNKYSYKNFYTSVCKIDKDYIGSNLHEVFALSTEVPTPNVLLSERTAYNELILKSPKIVGVLAPNKKSVEFAKSVANQNAVAFLGTLNPAEKVLG